MKLNNRLMIILLLLPVVLILAGIGCLRVAYKRGSELGAVGAGYFYAGLLLIVGGIAGVINLFL